MIESNLPVDTPSRPTTTALVGFVVAAVVLPCAIFSCQFVSWFFEQFGIISASTAALVHTGKITLLIQGLVILVTAGAFYAFTRNTLRPIYQGWLIASLFAFPAIVLRFVDTNQDQIGSLIQIALALIASVIVFFIRRRSLQFDVRSAFRAWAVVPLVAWPLVVWGGLGSGSEALLNLLAGLSFGLLVALLASTTDNFLLNGLGFAVLLAILGSAFGYDGQQLILLAILIPASLIIAALSPSVVGVAVGVGVLTAIPIMFFDSTEFAIVLGDLAPWVMQAVVVAVVLLLIVGGLMWLIGKWQGRPKTIAVPLAASLVGWVGVLVVYFVLGQPGFYGDRLFVVLSNQVDLSDAYAISDRTERIDFVYQMLTEHANTTQADLRKTFDTFGIRYQPYYLVNAIEVEGGLLVRLYLATRPEVDRVIASPHLRPLPEPSPSSPGPFTSIEENPGWNIQFIGADRVWNEFGVTGQGIVIGNSDTGVQGDHPNLRDAYRGLTEGDNYNWYDPWEGSASPNDQSGHGTHTTGTVLGSSGIGVAPGAQWIGCVNLERNLGNPAVYLDCMQFMLAPFPQNGDPFTDGDPSKAPHVLNNSWGCPPIEGCDPTSLEPAANALRAAGIFVVVSVGNDGPLCSTANSPPALYDSVFSVGAIGPNGDMADFSSRGPVTADGSNRIKPDIVAPGVDVFSSTPEGTYAAFPGTSMAGPHVVGAVALLWSAQPDLIGDIDRTEQILIDSAQPYTGTINAGCFEGGTPNNAYGYGVLDVYAAVKMAVGK